MYFCFLAMYILVLYQRGGRPQVSLTLQDYIFYGWACSLWVEELHQWLLDF